MSGDRPDRPPGERPGLQGERTELAWERSALGLLAAAALLLFRHVGPDLSRLLLALADLALALLIVWFGQRRARHIRAMRPDRSGRTTVPDVRREIVWVGGAAAVIALATALVLAFQA